MIVLGLCLFACLVLLMATLFVGSVYVFVDRCIALGRAKREDENFMSRTKGYIHEGELQSALNLCANANTPYSRLIAKGITRLGRPMGDVLSAMEYSCKIEIAGLCKGLRWLATTAAAAPMLGMLGLIGCLVFPVLAHNMTEFDSTITGMIYGPILLAIGLIIGLLALFAYSWLKARINKTKNKMEVRTMEFMDLLNEPVA